MGPRIGWVVGTFRKSLSGEVPPTPLYIVCTKGSCAFLAVFARFVHVFWVFWPPSPYGFEGFPDPVVRWHTAVALGDIGHEGGIPYLAKLVKDPIPFVRAHVSIALAQIGHRDGLVHLGRLSRILFRG